MWYDDQPLLLTRKSRQRNRRTHRRKDPVLRVKSNISSRHKQGPGRKVAAAIAAVGLVGVFGWGVIYGFRIVGQKLFSTNPQYAVTEFDVMSDGVLSAAQILRHGGLPSGINLFAFNLKEVRTNLEDFAIIKSVELKRQLPDKLIIRVKEREAIARLGPADTPYQLVVDRDGVIIRKSFQAGHLPLILGVNRIMLKVGDSIADTPGRDALAAIEICESKTLNAHLKVKTVAVGHHDYLDVRLQGGEHLLVPRDRIESRLRHAAATIQVNADLGKSVGLIDLTPKTNVIVKYL